MNPIIKELEFDSEVLSQNWLLFETEIELELIWHMVTSEILDIGSFVTTRTLALFLKGFFRYQKYIFEINRQF